MGQTGTVSAQHQVSVLGPLEVALKRGEQLAINGVRKRALLAALVLRVNRTTSTDQLIEAVWGRDAPSKALAALRVHVSHLRRMLEVGRPGLDDPIATVAEGYSLRVPEANVDVWCFEQSVKRGRERMVDDPAVAMEHFDRALQLWRGDPYPELIHDPAAIGEVARLVELHRTVEDELVDTRLALGHHHLLVPQLEKLTDAEPLRERRWAQLMLALYRSGRQSAALRAFQKARSLLREDLGLEPGAALRQLETLVLDQDSELDLGSAPRSQPSERGRLVGRQHDRHYLADRAEESLAGHGAMVVVSGEPGIGKTALLEDLCRQPVWRRFVGGVAQFPAHDVAASWPLVHALASIRENSGKAPTTSSSQLPETEDAANESLIRELLELARLNPVALLLEDVHNAGESTVRLLERLAIRMQSEGPCCLLVVVSMRRGTQSDRLLTAVGTDRIELSPFTSEEIGRYVAAESGHELSASEVSAVARRSGGVPLLLEAMCDAATVADMLTGVPPSMPSIVAARTSHLHDHSRAVLEAAAVLGEHFSVGRLGQLYSSNGSDLLVALDAASAAGLVVVDGPTGRFRHGLLCDAVLAGVAPSRRAMLHDVAASALEILPLPDSVQQASELARHAIGALTLDGVGPTDRCRRAHRASLDAGRDALARGSYAEAAAHFANVRLALDHLGPEQDEVEALDACQAEAGAHMSCGATTNAIALLDHVVSRARARREPTRFADAVLTLSLQTSVPGGLPTPVEMLQAEALELLGPADSEQRVRLLDQVASNLVLTDQVERRRDLASEALQMAKRLGDPLLLSEAFTGMHQACALSGNLHERIRWADAAVLSAGLAGNETQQAHARTHQLKDSIEAGDRAKAEIALHALGEHAVRSGSTRYIWAAKAWEVFFDLLADRGTEAEANGLRALEVWGEVPNPDAVACHLAQLTTRYLMVGRHSEARDLLTQAVAQRPDLTVARLMLAYALASANEPALADSQLAELGPNPLRSLVDDPTRLLGLAMLAELARLLDRPKWVSELADLLVPHRDQHVVVNMLGGGGIYWGSIHHHLGTTLMCLGDVANAKSSLRRGLDAHRLLGAPHWVERSKIELEALSQVL